MSISASNKGIMSVLDIVSVSIWVLNKKININISANQLNKVCVSVNISFQQTNNVNINVNQTNNISVRVKQSNNFCFQCQYQWKKQTMLCLLYNQCQIRTQCQLCSIFDIEWLYIWHWMAAYLGLTAIKLWEHIAIYCFILQYFRIRRNIL